MDDSIRDRLKALIKTISDHRQGFSPDSQQSPHMAEIQVIIAEEQSKSAQKLEQQTDTLISLTRWLFRLTWILVVLTAGLLVFTYFLVKHG